MTTRTLLIILLFLGLNLFSKAGAEKKDSLNIPFDKGNWLAILNGNLSSVNLDRFNNSQASVNLSNEYDFLIASGNFIIPRLAVGITFNASRSESRRISEIVTERFSIGPFVRYYLSDNPKGSMYLTGGLIYGQITEKSKIVTPNFETTVDLFGKGPGVIAGLGYSHFFTKNLGLDVSIRYDYLRLDTEVHDKTNNTRTFENIAALRSFFGFGFIIIIPEFVF